MFPTGTPVALAAAVCITGTALGSEAITLGILASNAAGAAGIGLKLTPAPVDVVGVDALEIAKLTAGGGCSPEVPLAVGVAELAFTSGCNAAAASFSACSRANWKHVEELVQHKKKALQNNFFPSLPSIHQVSSILIALSPCCNNICRVPCDNLASIT